MPTATTADKGIPNLCALAWLTASTLGTLGTVGRDYEHAQRKPTSLSVNQGSLYLFRQVRMPRQPVNLLVTGAHPKRPGGHVDHLRLEGLCGFDGERIHVG